MQLEALGHYVLDVARIDGEVVQPSSLKNFQRSEDADEVPFEVAEFVDLSVDEELVGVQFA